MTTRTILSVLAAVAAAALATGCATLPPARPGDALFEAGDFAGAVAAYEEVVRRKIDPALLESMPQQPPNMIPHVPSGPPCRMSRIGTRRCP